MKKNEQEENKLKTKLIKTNVCDNANINKVAKLNAALRKNLIRRKKVES